MDKETKFQIEVIKEQAKILWATTFVSWFTRLKYRLYKPFRDLRVNLEDRVVKFVDGRKARKQAHEDHMYSVLLKAAEDCVALGKIGNLDVLKFDATREISPFLKSALHEYLRTHKHSSTYGTLLEKALKKDPMALPGSRILSSGPASDRRITHKERYLKTVNNQIMWNYKKRHNGQTPRDTEIKHLKEKIAHAEGLISGEIKKTTFVGTSIEAREKDYIENVDTFKAKLTKLESSNG